MVSDEPTIRQLIHDMRTRLSVGTIFWITTSHVDEPFWEYSIEEIPWTLLARKVKTWDYDREQGLMYVVLEGV